MATQKKLFSGPYIRSAWIISYKKFSSLLFLIDFLNFYIDFTFLISLVSLFHSSIQYGEIVELKLFVPDGTHLKLPDDNDLKGYLL